MNPYEGMYDEDGEPVTRSANEILLEARGEELRLSNIKLIAELGMIAQALGVEPSMTKVIAKIEELQAIRAFVRWTVRTR